METDKSSVSPGTLLTVEIDTVPPLRVVTQGGRVATIIIRCSNCCNGIKDKAQGNKKSDFTLLVQMPENVRERFLEGVTSALGFEDSGWLRLNAVT